jgi:hypothetical protein
MNNELLVEFDAATKELLQLLEGFNTAQINSIPYKDSWTAAQVAEHLHKSDSTLLKSMTGPAQPTTRQPDEHVQDIRNAFLDFTTKMTSPGEIIPENKTYDKQSLLNNLHDSRKQIRSVIENADLSVTCLYVEVKALGAPTRLELVNFVNVHTKRHIHQLKKIFKALSD